MQPAVSLRLTRETEYWLRSYRRTWRGSVLSSVVGPVAYFLAMGVGVGGLVDARSFGASSYLYYLAPGMLAATAMHVAVAESTHPVYGSIRFQRTYFAAAATPMRPADIVYGQLVFIALRVAMACGLYSVVVMAMGVAPPSRMLAALPVAVLTGVAFAAPVAAWAVKRTSIRPFNTLTRLVIAPLFVFSGVFFPVGGLPGWVRPAADLSPLWHGVDACRRIIDGAGWSTAVLVHVLVLTALTAGGVVACRVAFTGQIHR